MFKFKPTCSLCKAIGVNKLTCPLNGKSRKPDKKRHMSPERGDTVEAKDTTGMEGAEGFNIADISAFFTSNRRGKNDAMNKKREEIIYNIMTNNINPEWYEENPNWKIIDQKLRTCLTDYTLKSHKGGRKHNYDFDVEYRPTGKQLKLEFKFNATSIKDCPQWLSLMNPSEYLSKSYEEHHYDNYVKPILDLYGGISIPEKVDYLKEVHSDKYLLNVQDLYKRGTKLSPNKFTGNEEDIIRCQETCRLTDESLQTFFQSDVELNVEKLNACLLTTQKDKIYLLYCDGMFRLETREEADYTIDPLSITNTHNSFKCTSISGIKINILLRWKNCKGVAFPAFQIT